MNVNHPTLGIGIVVNSDENNVTVDFSGVQKTLVIAFCKLTTEDGLPFGKAFVAAEKKAKKVNRANFMTAEQIANFVPMTRNEYEADRKKAQIACKSW